MVWKLNYFGDNGDSVGGDEEDTGGGHGCTKTIKCRRRRHPHSATSANVAASARWMIITMFIFFLISGTAAVLSNSTFKGTFL
jgi:hypothetical protein